MLIDLAHVTVQVMNQVLDMSEAPVIFSHSSAYGVCKHKRNVPDDILRKVVSLFCKQSPVVKGNDELYGSHNRSFIVSKNVSSSVTLKLKVLTSFAVWQKTQ